MCHYTGKNKQPHRHTTPTDIRGKNTQEDGSVCLFWAINLKNCACGRHIEMDKPLQLASVVSVRIISSEDYVVS